MIPKEKGLNREDCQSSWGLKSPEKDICIVLLLEGNV